MFFFFQKIKCFFFQVSGESGGADSPVQRGDWRVRVASNGGEEATGRVRAGEFSR